MAITFKDGVILGADSRTTTGAYIANRVTDKLTQVHDTIWCCRSGSAADTQAVADIVHYYLGMYGITNDDPPTTQTAASMFQELCYANKDQLRHVGYHCPTRKSTRLTQIQCRHDHRRLRPTTRWPSIFNTARRFSTQTNIRDRWIGFNVHLWILRRQL